MTMIVVGVDGGGTRTRARVADETGAEIVTVEGPASAVRPGAAEHSADVIAGTVRDALAAAAMEHVTPKVVCVGVAGVGREAERDALWQALTSREVAEDVVRWAESRHRGVKSLCDGHPPARVQSTGRLRLSARRWTRPPPAPRAGGTA